MGMIPNDPPGFVKEQWASKEIDKNYGKGTYKIYKKLLSNKDVFSFRDKKEK